jgi:CheY-like chemotaxis protein
MNTPGFNYRVLVVDDEPAVLETSALVLKDRGFEVRKASDGFEALVELRRSAPDVIISDLRMPNMSGFELLSVVRRRFPHIPVIAISGEYAADSPAVQARGVVPQDSRTPRAVTRSASTSQTR